VEALRAWASRPADDRNPIMKAARYVEEITRRGSGEAR
jgi:hypothetical protein